MNTQTLTMERISILKEELAALKRERKADALAKKMERTWVNAEKRLPDSNTNRVIVWSGGQMKLGWFSIDKCWYEYNGTWLTKREDQISDVTHWMPTDWMSATWWPPCGPGLLNRLRYLARKIRGSAYSTAASMVPKSWSSNAQISKKICYWRDVKSGKLKMGLPENFPAPDFHEKIVCGSSYEAEHWSEMMRQQDRRDDQRYAETRGAKEEEIKKEIRGELLHRMSNARNSLNREFLRVYMEKHGDRSSDPTAARRESYLHSEGFEDGH